MKNSTLVLNRRFKLITKIYIYRLYYIGFFSDHMNINQNLVRNCAIIGHKSHIWLESHTSFLCFFKSLNIKSVPFQNKFLYFCSNHCDKHWKGKWLMNWKRVHKKYKEIEKRFIICDAFVFSKFMNFNFHDWNIKSETPFQNKFLCFCSNHCDKHWQGKWLMNWKRAYKKYKEIEKRVHSSTKLKFGYVQWETYFQSEWAKIGGLQVQSV